ncbi:pentapeptide repeat-containing protein [Dechloromonas sp. ZY10]|uniref:KGGVGR-motif variant AAA ATPase n=1 Tax=Dechloromonas aquae TaxID=2664436 RepID=UPI0035295E45
MSLTVTLYSYKGGVGRSVLAANLAVLLARHGKTLICDFDLEAPGLHRINDLSTSRENKSGLFEWLHHWQEKRKFDAPTQRDLERLGKNILPCEKQSNLYLLPAHGEETNAADLYQQIDWGHFLAVTPETGLKMLRAMLTHLREKEGFRYIVLDSRTGITDIGGFLTAWLPDVTLLVGNYGAQNTGGLNHIWEALKDHVNDPQRGENGQYAELKLELVASPIPADQPEVSAKLRSQWEKDFGLAADSLIEIPERSELRRSEAILALSETDSPIVRKYHEVAARLLAIEAENERAAQAESIAQRQRPELYLDLRKPDSRAKQGKTFEERIADLLRLLGYRVEPEQTLDGNRIDLIASIQQGLDTATYFVECKDHEKAVGKEIIETLDVWLRTPKALERGARGMVVARRFSPQAQELAKGRQIRCFTPEDLERALIDFSTYLNRLISEFANSPLAASYIEQKIQPEKQADQTLPLLPYAQAWSRGEHSRLWVLLGDYGTGKTAFTRRFAYDLAQQALGNPENPIPLLINLRDFPNKTSLGDLLHDHWQRQTGERRDPAIFLHLLARGRLILLIDSFDEMGVAQAHRNVVEQFRMLAQPSDSAGDNPRANRVLITCREQFFREHGEAQQTVHRLSDRLAALEQAARGFDGNIDVLPRFDHEQIQQYLSTRLGKKDGKQAWKDIRNIYNLASLADRPQLLDIIIGSLPDLKRSGEAVTAGALYLRYTNCWLNDYRHSDRQSNSNELLVILEALAVELWQRDGQRIHHGDLYALIKDRRLPSQLDPATLDIELRTAAFLSRTPDGYYGFSHRSFLEFFYARALLKATENNPEALAAKLNGPIPSREAAVFFADLLALHEVMTQKQAQQNIAAILAKEDGNAPGSPLLTRQTAYPANARRNAYLLGYWASRAYQQDQVDWLPLAPQRINLAGCQCQDLVLPGANLANAQLQGSDWSRSVLDGANLSQADASGANFWQAILANANLSASKLDRVQGKEADLRHANLSHTSARNSQWIKALFQHSDLSEADFSNTDLRAARLANSQGEVTLVDSCLLGCTAPNSRAGSLPHPPAPPCTPHLQYGHSGMTTYAAFSPDGARIVSTSYDHTLRIWDTHSGLSIATLEGHQDWVRSATFSPDGARIVSASDDNTLRIWDAHSGLSIATLEGHQDRVRSATFSPDDTRIVSASDDHTLRIWDAHSYRAIATLEGHQDSVNSAAFSPDGTRIVSASNDRTLRIWDTHSKQTLATLKGHRGGIASAVFSPDGTHIVSASDDNTLCLWDAHSEPPLATLEGHQNRVRSATFSPDGARIVSASDDNTLRIWDARSGLAIATLKGHRGWVRSAVFSPDGTRIIAASLDNTLYIWDAHSSQVIAILEGHQGWATSAAFSPDGTRIISVSADNTLRTWDASSEQTLTILKGPRDWVRSAAFSPDGTRIIFASYNNTLRIWDAHSGLTRATLAGHQDWANSVAFSADGARIVSASDDRTLRLWDAHSGQPLASLEGHQDSVRSAAFSSDDTRIVSASNDNTLRIWDTHSGQPLTTLEGHQHWVMSAAFSPDGARIVSASYDRTLRIWDAHSWQPLATLEGHQRPVNSASFSPDGARIVSTSDDNTLRLWDAHSLQPLATLKGHQSSVRSAAFSPDGTRILSASYDNTLRIWDAHSGQLLRILWTEGEAWFSLDTSELAEGLRLDQITHPILRGQGPTPLVFIDPEDKLQPAPWIPRYWYADDFPALWHHKDAAD